MTVKMRVLVVLGLWLAVCKAILVRSAGNTSAVDTSAVRDNRETADQITPQESNERSTFYADNYPGKMFSTFLTLIIFYSLLLALLQINFNNS